MRVLENAVRLRRVAGCGCGDRTQRTVGWRGVDTAVGLAVGVRLVKRVCSDVWSEIDIALAGYERLDECEVLRVDYGCVGWWL